VRAGVRPSMHHGPPAIAERFRGDAELHALALPGDAVTRFVGAACQVWIVAADGKDWRCARLAVAKPPGDAELALAFPAFANAEEALFHVFVTEDTGKAVAAALPGALVMYLPSVRPPIALRTHLDHVPPLPPVPRRAAWLVEGGQVVPDGRIGSLRLASDLGTYWRDHHGAHAAGWVHLHGTPIRSLGLAIGESVTPLAPHSRADVVKHYPECGDVLPAGFKGYVPGEPGLPLEFEIETEQGRVRCPVPIPDRFRALPEPAGPMTPAFHRFVELVNEGGLSVLEIGGRVVGPEAEDWRLAMAGAASYTGFDVHPSRHVQVVGDAHRLARHVPPGSQDAIWSSEVLEHLAQPWLAAAEINRALKPGGITYHRAPHTWPIHEAPADYWRFSDEGLRILFGPAFGFEVLASDLAEPVRIHPTQRDGPWSEMPVFPGYGHAGILARKIAELPPPGGLEAHLREYLPDAARLYTATDRAERERETREQIAVLGAEPP
jgi:SAM-dependent methyltransferase